MAIDPHPAKACFNIGEDVTSYRFGVLDMRTQNGDEPVGEITFLGVKLPF